MRYVVAPVEEIPPGARKVVEVGRRSIGVFNLDGEFFALRNSCPHQGGPLCEGRIWGPVTATVPGEFDHTPVREMVTCPWHGWEFHIRTGRSWCDPERLRTGDYPVGVLSGRELLGEADPAAPDDPATPDDPADPVGAGRVPGPYRAEQVTVRVEDDYVVLDVH